MQAAHFIHGNRLELLAERLIDDLQAGGSGDPLQPQVVVVAHPALGRWLQERIAARCGIAINIEFPLPSTFAWQVLRRFSGTLPRESAFSREALTWRIHAALPELARGKHFERVRDYLGDPGDQRQRYELAVNLARLFDEYTMARPQWIREWTHGRLLLDDA
ncbi:exodeoxyribonuclease V subunit gamma, partial [Dokdonella sp.]